MVSVRIMYDTSLNPFIKRLGKIVHYNRKPSVFYIKDYTMYFPFFEYDVIQYIISDYEIRILKDFYKEMKSDIINKKIRDMEAR